MVVGWSVVFIVLGWIRQRPLRDLLVRPRHLRPGRLAALALPRPVRHRPRARVLRSPRQPDPGAVRALLLVGRGAAVPAVGAGRGAGVGCDRDLPAGPRPDPRPLARGGDGRGPAAQPHLPVAHVGVLPPRCARHRAAAFAYWAARTARWKWFVLFAVLAAACKEDVVLAIAVMGVLVAVRGHRKIGLLTVAASIAWYTIADAGDHPVAERDRSVLRQLLRRPRQEPDRRGDPPGRRTPVRRSTSPPSTTVSATTR